MAQPTAPAASDEKVKKHMKKMRQAKNDKPKQRKGCIAKQIQLQQMGEEMHGPRHLAAAIEQNAHLLSSVVTKAAGAATWEADENHMPNSPSKVRKQTMRRPMQQAAHRLTSAKRVTPFTLQQMEHPDTWLHLAIDPREEKSSFYDETMENMVLAAEVPYVVAQPAEHDQLQERVGVGVQLGEKRPESLPGTYRVMPSASPCSSLPEDSFVYVEYISASQTLTETVNCRSSAATVRAPHVPWVGHTLGSRQPWPTNVTGSSQTRSTSGLKRSGGRRTTR